MLAANAAFQQYSGASRVDAYAPLVYEVHRAGYIAMSDLAFLIAVQAAVRGETSAPAGLSPPQRDEVSAWLGVVSARAFELRARLGIGNAAAGQPRPTVFRFDDVEVEEDATTSRRIAFRWHTHRAWLGSFVGLILGGVLTFLVAWPWLVLAGTAAGHVVGRRLRAVRCSSCATVIGSRAESCRECGVTLRGDIARLSDRLEAEERLEAPHIEARSEISASISRTDV